MKKEQKYCIVGTSITRNVRKCISQPYETRDQAEEHCRIRSKRKDFIYIKVAKYPYKEKKYRQHEQ